MKLLKGLSLAAILVLGLHGHAQNSSFPCPANIVVTADEGKEGAIVTFPAFTTVAAEIGTLKYTPSSGSFFRLGSHSIIVTSSNGQKCSFTVTVTDNESPLLSPITLSREALWPESNKMKKVNVFYTIYDNGQHVKTSITVSSNATDGIKDWEIVDDHSLLLKSSRLPDESPRIYTITVMAIDEAGNKTTRATTIAVSKTMTAVAAK